MALVRHNGKSIHVARTEQRLTITHQPLSTTIYRSSAEPLPKETSNAANRRSVTEAVKEALHLNPKAAPDVESLEVDVVILMPSKSTSSYYADIIRDDKWEDEQLPDLAMGSEDTAIGK